MFRGLRDGTEQAEGWIFLFLKAIQVIFCSSYEFLMATVYFQRKEILKKTIENCGILESEEKLSQKHRREREHSLHSYLGPCGRHSTGGGGADHGEARGPALKKRTLLGMCE